MDSTQALRWLDMITNLFWAFPHWGLLAVPECATSVQLNILTKDGSSTWHRAVTTNEGSGGSSCGSTGCYVWWDHLGEVVPAHMGLCVHHPGGLLVCNNYPFSHKVWHLAWVRSWTIRVKRSVCLFSISQSGIASSSALTYAIYRFLNLIKQKTKTKLNGEDHYTEVDVGGKKEDWWSERSYALMKGGQGERLRVRKLIPMQTKVLVNQTHIAANSFDKDAFISLIVIWQIVESQFNLNVAEK